MRGPREPEQSTGEEQAGINAGGMVAASVSFAMCCDGVEAFWTAKMVCSSAVCMLEAGAAGGSGGKGKTCACEGAHAGAGAGALGGEIGGGVGNLKKGERGLLGEEPQGEV